MSQNISGCRKIKYCDEQSVHRKTQKIFCNNLKNHRKIFFIDIDMDIKALLTDYLNYLEIENPRPHFVEKIQRRPASPITGCAYSARAGCSDIQSVIVAHTSCLANGKMRAGRSFLNL